MVTRRQRIDMRTTLVLLAGVVVLVNGQDYTPNVARSSAFSFHEGEKLYVRGGYVHNIFPMAPINQMFSIDLSIPWTTSFPAFKSYPSPGSMHCRAFLLTKDGKKLISFQDQNMTEFTLENQLWDMPTRLEGFRNVKGFFAPGGSAVDPVTGKFYIPNGKPNNATGVDILEYEPSDRTSRVLPPAPGSDKWNRVMVTWSDGLNRMFIFGGSTGAIDPITFDTIQYWSPGSGWGADNAKGTVPTTREDACLVPAYNGSKLILFGGYVPLMTFFSDIYIYDVATKTWKQGVSEESGGGRRGMACAVTNDRFISWGGFNYIGPVKKGITLVYNMKTDAWETDYSPEPSADPIKDNDPIPEVSSQKPNLGLIIGASVGGLAVIIGAVALWMFLRRRKAKKAGVEKWTAQEEKQDRISGSDLGPDTVVGTNPSELELTERRPQTAAHGWGVHTTAVDALPFRHPKDTGHSGQSQIIRNEEFDTELLEDTSQRVGKEEYRDSPSAGAHPQGYSIGLSTRYGKEEYIESLDTSGGSQGQPQNRDQRHGKAEYNEGHGQTEFYDRHGQAGLNDRHGKAEYHDRHGTESHSKAYGKEEYNEGYDVEEDRIPHPHFRSPFEGGGENNTDMENNAKDPQHGRGFGHLDSRGSVQPIPNKGPRPSQDGSGASVQRQSGSSRKGHKAEFNQNDGATPPNGRREDPHALSPFLKGTFQAMPEPDPRHPEYVSARHAPLHNNDNYWYHSSSAAFSNATNGSRNSRSASTKTGRAEQSRQESPHPSNDML